MARRKKLNKFQMCMRKKLKGRKRGGRAEQRKRFTKAAKECHLEAYYKG